MGKHRARWHCSACNKTAYGSESRAREVIKMFEGQGDYVPVRAYPCPYNTGAWHLTSKEKLTK